MSCIPSVRELEGFHVEFLQLVLRAHGIHYDANYDRYDLLALALLAYRMDCPQYTAKQVADLRRGRGVRMDPNVPTIVARLIPLQYRCVQEMRRIARRHWSLLNTSDPGTGKTLMGLAFGVLEGKRIYIVTKTNIVGSWLDVIRKYDVKGVVGITSYELGIHGKEYLLDSYDREGEWKAVHVPSRYITRKETTKKRVEGRTGGHLTYTLGWQNLENTLVIWDEPHSAKNESTYAHRLMIACYEYMKREADADNLLLLLGATPADKVEDISYLETILELPKEQKVKSSVRRVERKTMDTPFIRLNRVLYSKDDPRAVRVSKEALEEQLGVSLPVTVTIQAFEMGREAERVIEEQNQRIATLIAGIREESGGQRLKEIQAARRVIELQKMPKFAEMAVEELSTGRSVIIFVEFYESSDVLFELLEEYAPRLLTGRMKSLEERERLLRDFREGRFDLLITHTAIAREGVGMHDTRGGKPRTTISTSVWSGTVALQILGRADRLCRLSDTRQYIVYAQSLGGTGWDARVAEVMRNKLRNLKELNLGTKAAQFMQEVYREAGRMRAASSGPTSVELPTSRLESPSIRPVPPLRPPGVERVEAERELEEETGLEEDEEIGG
jgi:hypothetical protein